MNLEMVSPGDRGGTCYALPRQPIGCLVRDAFLFLAVAAVLLDGVVDGELFVWVCCVQAQPNGDTSLTFELWSGKVSVDRHSSGKARRPGRGEIHLFVDLADVVWRTTRCPRQRITTSSFQHSLEVADGSGYRHGGSCSLSMCAILIRRLQAPKVIPLWPSKAPR